MTWYWSRPAILALLLLAGPAPAAWAQQFEAGLQGVATLADRAFAGGGVSLGWRSGPRARVVAMGALGSDDGDGPAVRGELTAHFLLSPRSRRATLYAGGGIAGVAGPHGEAGFVVLALGIESRPSARTGWVLETGLGGGVRVLVGYRWRWGRSR
ncbi:MAG: hypothetical protein AB7Q69_08715 [Gemmatimonadales bacterium]